MYLIKKTNKRQFEMLKKYINEHNDYNEFLHSETGEFAILFAYDLLKFRFLDLSNFISENSDLTVNKSKSIIKAHSYKLNRDVQIFTSSTFNEKGYIDLYSTDNTKVKFSEESFTFNLYITTRFRTVPMKFYIVPMNCLMLDENTECFDHLFSFKLNNNLNDIHVTEFITYVSSQPQFDVYDIEGNLLFTLNSD